jgi:tight adherence protein C
VFLLLIGLVAIGLSVSLFAKAIAHKRHVAVNAVSTINWYGYGVAALEARESGRQRLRDLVNRAAHYWGRPLLQTRLVDEHELARELRSAGIYVVTPEQLVGYRALAAVALPFLWLLFTMNGHTSFGRLLLGVLLGAAAGWWGPLVVIRRRARLRLELIDDQVPDLIDLLVTTVEAGMAFTASLQIAASRFHGPLGQELRLMLREQDLGLATDEALTHLAERVDTPAMRSFVRAVLQGQKLGVSIGKIMRDLADDMRKIRRQKAEERAQKAPTKMLFPLVFLIFPAMFIVMLGPALAQMLHSLKGL